MIKDLISNIAQNGQAANTESQSANANQTNVEQEFSVLMNQLNQNITGQEISDSAKNQTSENEDARYSESSVESELSGNSTDDNAEELVFSPIQSFTIPTTEMESNKGKNDVTLVVSYEVVEDPKIQQISAYSSLIEDDNPLVNGENLETVVKEVKGKILAQNPNLKVETDAEGKSIPTTSESEITLNLETPLVFDNPLQQVQHEGIETENDISFNTQPTQFIQSDISVAERISTNGLSPSNQINHVPFESNSQQTNVEQTSQINQQTLLDKQPETQRASVLQSTNDVIWPKAVSNGYSTQLEHSFNSNNAIDTIPQTVRQGQHHIARIDASLQNIQPVQSEQNEVIQNFGDTKQPQLIQVIQSHKAELVKPISAKDQKFALSRFEQAETRLRLLVDSARPEVLPGREAPVGFITSHSLDERIQFFNPTLTLSTDQEAMLKEFMIESSSGKDQNSQESTSFGYIRLGELPVLNSEARRSLVNSFSSVLQQEMTSSARQSEEHWQKHSFKLDDGNNIDLTTRNVDGVLQIKLAASNPELNRLLLSMEQEIKDHLKEELNIELDLQFEDQHNDSFSDDLQNDDSSAERAELTRKLSALNEEEKPIDIENRLQTSIRHFGYNQMEWTA